MTVFISYCRQDEALAHLLCHALKSGDIKCLIDRDLPKGRPFDNHLKQMIRDADVVLVLLTKNSLKSQWVNQEIGYAAGRKKRVYPLALQRGVEPEGLIKLHEKYSLLDWSKPEQTIRSLIEELKKEGSNGRQRSTYIPLSIMLDGREARTKFLIARLTQLARDPERELLIDHQAAFSIFAASSDPMYQEAGDHSDVYIKLLLRERKALNHLVQRRKTKFRLLLWPFRHYDVNYRAIRFRNLLRWLRSVEQTPTIDVRCGEYLEPNNRLIVHGEFVLDGRKPAPTAGYGTSEAFFDPEKIKLAAQRFEDLWKALEPQTKTQAIEMIEDMYRKLGLQE